MDAGSNASPGFHLFSGATLLCAFFIATDPVSAATSTTGRLVYGVGMTAPFVLAAFFVAPFMRFMARFRRHLGVVEKVMGALLVLFGILIATNAINYIANWLVLFWPEIG